MSDGNVIHFGAPTRVDLSANEVLRAAIGDNLNHVVIIGYTEDGGFHFRTTTADLAEISLLMRQANVAIDEYMRGED